MLNLRIGLALWLLAIPAVALADNVAVEFSSPMRYHANAVNPGLGSSWVDLGFDDSTWPVGAYGVGY
jgi:hypothetical protein